ncbi:hypothetical protein EG834_09620, partial [bacterium]|nr:hypothetical protein [bacterium]
KATAGDTINVLAGMYVENVNVNKAVTIVGAGSGTTSIVGTTGNATPLTFSTSAASVSGFTITHNYTQAELDAWNFNNNGVTFNQGTSGNHLENCTVSLNRNGIYLNNSQNQVITGNTITNNRTGINLTNTVNGTQITDNTISGNWTLGLVYYSQGQATDFSTVVVSGNTFASNWYSEILIKNAGTSTGALDISGNTFTDDPVTYTTSADTSLNEPGFGDLKPVALGGTATQPAQDLPTIRIYNSPTASFLTGPKTLQVGAAPLFTTIQEAIDAASAGDTINVTSGTYILTETLRVNKDVTLVGIDHPLIQVSGTGYKISMTAAGATLQGFWIESTDKADQQAILYVAASNLTIQDNKIWGTYVFGESQVSRAMVFTGGLSGLTIVNNEIYDLRQPGYISGVTTGTISNNFVYRTRGWVVEQGNMTFTGNTWGSGADANVYDIAILATVSPTYYTDVPALSEANNNASIEDQRTSPATLSIVYVDASIAASGT